MVKGMCTRCTKPRVSWARGHSLASAYARVLVENAMRARKALPISPLPTACECVTNEPNTSPPTAVAPDFLNRLHHVDATQFVRALPAQSVDMLLTDPPYSSGGLHSSARTKAPSQKYILGSTKAIYEDFESDNMDQRSWAWWCQGWLSEARRALKAGGLVVCFIDWRQLPTLTDVIQGAGYTMRGIAVWDKTTGRSRPRKGGFKQQAEFIVWASKGALREHEVYLPGVFSHALALPKQHVTQKPLALAREIVRLVPQGGTVCDLFAGSGTFLVAAREAGLQWAGCEMNPVYYRVAAQRLGQ
jgi:site-specific DNA-methyltransferase (adenine-specific)